MEPANSSRRRFQAETRRIAAKLVRGRETTVQLQYLLRSATATEHDRRALAAEILSCLTDAISVLESSESAGDEISCPDHSLCSDLDSGNSQRSPPVKDLGRGNKRRRLANTTIVTKATTEDGHAWRKYGQKVILNTTHPKSYYRCTHKYDRGCGATKHVQRMEGDSEIKYKITYISNHTCGGQTSSPMAAEAAETPASASDSYNIGFSASDFWPSDENTRSGVRDEMDLWSGLNDFGSWQETTMTNHYYFSTGDDADSSRMFWG